MPDADARPRQMPLVETFGTADRNCLLQREKNVQTIVAVGIMKYVTQ